MEKNYTLEPAEIAQACCDYAVRAHDLLGCRGLSRTDFRWDDSRGLAERNFEISEVNEMLQGMERFNLFSSVGLLRNGANSVLTRVFNG